ncbi:MAG: hypothetical protein PVJ43_15640, partial [Gemmatimonadales bacterium]
MNDVLSSILAVATLGLPLMGCGPAASQGQPTPANPVVQAELAADSLDDGPHVYWQSDRTAIVFYLCRDSLVTQT